MMKSGIYFIVIALLVIQDFGLCKLEISPPLQFDFVWFFGHPRRAYVDIYCAHMRERLKCYCDENFVFSFPVFLALTSYLDLSLLESVTFSTS